MNTKIKLLFAGTIFSSAFLLFLVQPLISKHILPWFGGSAAVWATCMVFFQVVLLAGYAYADTITRHLVPRHQVILHVGLLIAGLAFLPIIPDPSWKPIGNEDPTLRILGLLVSTIGLPYFLLSTTGPLIQSWVSRTVLGAHVYRFFSLSNLASLVALICYPFVIEPNAPLLLQARGWSGVFALFVVLCSASAVYFLRHDDAPTPSVNSLAPETAREPVLHDYLLWLGLAAMGSWLLLAITNHITQNIAAIPLLWLLPLTVYLLTFVLCFESDRWYVRARFLLPTAALLVAGAYGLQGGGLGYGIAVAIPLYVLGLFCCCMFFHGELARLRPSPKFLTRFYLMLSLGGALGGISVGLIAPRILPAYYELGLGFVLTALLAMVLLRRQKILLMAAAALAGVCAFFLYAQVTGDFHDARRIERNFYGTLLSLDAHRENAADDVRQLYHGSVKHGEQYLAPARRFEPTTYYGRSAGIGLAIANTRAAGKKVGLIGLGAGTLAVYGQPGDLYRFYEINPQVVALAQSEFSFMRDSKARIERVLGDARLSLEKEPPHNFDVLAVDAFSGDSIPVHLITKQAMMVYQRHLAPQGIVAFHVTNRFVRLAPMVQKIAEDLGLYAILIHDQPQGAALRTTDWVLVAQDPAVLEQAAFKNAASPIVPIPGLRSWTDDFNNLFDVIKD